MSMTFYKNSVENFLKQSDDEILGIISKNDTFDTRSFQKMAWISQIEILKEQLSEIPEADIIFEYTIPRLGGRIDNVILYKGKIFVIEFKIGAESYEKNAIIQARTYAFDLSNFHEESKNRIIIPILIATEAPEKQITALKFKEKIYDVILSNGKNLSKIFLLFQQDSFSKITLEKWLNSRYLPTPNIIEAAEILYNQHSVSEISQNESAENLDKTVHSVQKIIAETKKEKKKAICFITGVPGAGKTLAGLDIAIENQKISGKSYSCFLSGNQPLVTVLKEALAKDDHERTGIKIGDAREKVKSFIQIIHHFRDTALMQIDTPPADNVVIFDEAQRAWHKEKLSKFMKEKKGNILQKLSSEKCTEILNMSEPELLIEYMNRHKDWSIIVCLVGGGQDINEGEAGIKEWFNAISHSFRNWNVYISSKITEDEYIGLSLLNDVLQGINFQIVDDLHLSVSLRSFRSEKVSKFVQELLDNHKENAAKLYNEIKKVYPISMTRNLNVAKNWLLKQTKDKDCRYGIIASSKAKRLRAEGIWVECACNPEKWFLEGKENIKSSYYFEEVATEFDIQGLEIDWAIVAWDADYRYENDKFECYTSSGSRWNKIKKEEDRRYLKNAYRVLLTRAREGFILFIPKGDNSDNTRLCYYYDNLWNYLNEIGIEIIQ